MLSTAFTILHIVACIFLVIVVLLQTGKGTDVNAVFGGSSQTIFGSSGAGNFLTRLTTATAVVFMATSLYLTYGAVRQTTKSVFDTEPQAPAVTTPVTPEQPPAAPGSSGTPSDKPAEAPAASQTAPTTPAPTSSTTPTINPPATASTTPAETPAQGAATTNVAPATPPSSGEAAKTSEAPPSASAAPK